MLLFCREILRGAGVYVTNMVDSVTDPQDFLKKYYPGGYYGFDREGRAVFYEPLGQVDFWGILHSVKPEEVMKYKVGHCEKAKKLWEQQELTLEKKIDGYSTLVLDAQGAGRKHLWKPGLEVFKSIVGMYDRDFPNLRKRILIVRAPAIFPMLFSILSPFLRQETKDKIKVLGSNWQERLQKYIDPSQIPIYYGGTCKDEDDDEKCGKYICYGGEVPISFYTTEKAKQAEFQATIIKAGRKLTIEFQVTIPETKMTYQFVTSDFDIQFSVHFEKGASESEEEKKEYLVPKSRKQSHIMMEEGEIMCKNIGKYVFTFDNRYSWMRDKELFFFIKADGDAKPEIIENEANSDVTNVADDVTNDVNELEIKDVS